MKKVLSLLLAVVMVIGMLPLGVLTASAEGEVTQLASFELGANGTATHKDGSSAKTEYSETNNGYTLNITGGDKMYPSSYDAKGNSCIKFGSSSAVGKCSFTVPADVTQVVISVAKYKANTTKIDVNGTAYTLTKNSNDGAYDAITVDTTTTKTVNFTTVSGGVRAMLNTITFYGAASEGDEHVCSWTSSSITKEATCTEDGEMTYTCTCGETMTEVIKATGHNYLDNVCSKCGEEDPNATVDEHAVAIFRLGENGSGPHADGKENATYTEAAGDYTLEITGGTKMYTGAMDEKGNGCIKLGTGSVAGGFSFTVPADVTEVVICVAGYKATAAKIDINGTEYTTTKNSNDGAYDEITVDTANTKTVTFTTVSGGLRAMVNTITFRVTDVEVCTHANTTTNTVDATCTTDGSVTVTCDDCGETISTEIIEATGHNYVNGTCSSCGDVEVVAPSNSQATISFATTEQRVSQDTESQVWSNDGLTVTNNKAASTSNIIDSSSPVRFYKSSELVFEFKGMTKIEVTCNTADYATALVNSISDTAAATANGTVVTIVLDGAVDTFTVAALSAQVRVNSITVYAEVSSDCTHEWGDWVDTTAATCTTAGLQTATCTLCGQTKTQSVAATGHTYTVSGDTVACACGETLTISTIAEAKAFTDTTAVYCVKGIVTYVKGGTVYIEDATGGICVYFTNTVTVDLQLGDEIVVWDCLTKYNGLIETTYTTDTEYAKLSSGNALPSQTVTLAQLLADTTNEYLGERVVIEKVTMGTINTSGNTALTDADGNTLNIYKVSGLSADINEGDTVTVTAIVSTHNGYQLLINPGTAADDVIETAAGEETVVETVSIATAKAGEAGTYYQVEGVVTFIDGRNIYIQDATGGIVVYLTANNTTAAVGDKIKAYGALKTYKGLLELDGIDQTNTEFFEVLSSGNTVEAQTVTVADLMADTTNEYLAEKVTIKNAYISEVGSWSSSYLNVNYTITDGNSSIVIYRAPAATEADVLPVGTIVSLEAVVSTFDGYQLRALSAESITATAPVCMVNGVPYGTMTEALANYTAGSYVKLMQNVEVNVTLTADLYIDLNGNDLTGIMNTNGFKVYGMDGSTDEFTTQALGYFTCVDENEEDIVPETIVQTSVTGKARRYLAIYDAMTGYSFHRFYLGITHATVKPGTKGVGYKAIFAGDDMVKAQISSFGYTLQLEGNDAVTQSKAGTEMVSEAVVTLRVDNYDAEKYGTTNLSASVFMVIGDQTITADAVTMNLKTMVEAINAMTLDDAQKAAMAEWIAASETMKTWDVSNIYTAA